MTAEQREKEITKLRFQEKMTPANNTQIRLGRATGRARHLEPKA
jgi:hypothetical protein